ncbi:MAG: PTS transporter subunit EIIC [Proteobacteria bacterium]|nr:PTS transporter subunit EIIC [Pseudomonadota bacterium]
MLPIAVLPIAGLLLRLGQPDLLNMPFVSAAGEAIFSNLGLLFAIGVAVGLARGNHGAAGLASVVAYVVASRGAQVLITVPPQALAGVAAGAVDLAAQAYRTHELAKLSVPLGILCGLCAGPLYNRFHTIELPSYLSFFGGRRFVPIISGVAGLVLALLFGTQWQHLEQGMDSLSRSVLHAGAFGLFAYGVLNRVLIVTGLHHIINNIAWFLLGDYHGVTGDMQRFFAGDPSAGKFMSGFFPVMMFGLPAACLAMYHAAAPGRRRAVGGLLASMALTSILTGVTEPIEFTFMFLAPLLYAVHALLTGVAFIVMNLLQVRLGFGFSAGLFDYVLNFSRATRPLWLLPVGAAYFALYYVLFRMAIARFDLRTPGRERQAAAAQGAPAQPDEAAALPAGPVQARPRQWLAALGGAANLASVDACTTRLRLVLSGRGVVDEPALRALGARGLVRPAGNVLQVVVGPVADRLAEEIRGAMQEPGDPATAQAVPSAARESPVVVSAEDAALAARLLTALGGRTNVQEVLRRDGRLLVTVGSEAAVDEVVLGTLPLRGTVRAAMRVYHLLAGPGAAPLAAALQALLGPTPPQTGLG